MLQAMVNAEKYKEIILSGLVPSIESITERTRAHIPGRFRTLSSGALCKWFCKTLSIWYFKLQISILKSELGVESLDWPENSPNLNPIENVWTLMSAKMRKQMPKSMLELIKTIEKVWFEDITAEYLQALYDSMPNRVKCVIKAKGGTSSFNFKIYIEWIFAVL